MKHIKYLGLALIILFAIIGFVLVAGYFAVKLGLTDTRGIVDSIDRYSTGRTNYPWMQGQEWQVLQEAISKDEAVIKRAALAAGIPSRVLVSALVPEQLRLYYDEREIFKGFFAPLKILGNQTQFSWGVMGIKPDTAKAIEVHLNDPTSPYYPGPEYAHLLDSTSSPLEDVRFSRIANEDDHYYSYLYAALYLRQIVAQWPHEGYDLSRRPEILATLYNIGFSSSEPNKTPQIGGAEVEINGMTYSFGGLAYEFYYSDALIDYFPIE